MEMNLELLKAKFEMGMTEMSEPDYSTYGITKKTKKTKKKLSPWADKIKKLAATYSSSEMIDDILEDIIKTKSIEKAIAVLNNCSASGMEEDFIEEAKSLLKTF